MKILRVGSGSMVFLAAGVFLMAGCFSQTPNTPQSTQLSAICGAPKYNIVLGKIESSKESVLSRQEFRAVLDKALSESGCFVTQTKADEKSYMLDIKYSFIIAQTTEESAISSKDNKTLKSNVQFNLYNKSKTIQQNATSTLKMSEKKYLGIGDEVQFTQEQKEDVLKRSLKTIFTNLSAMP